MCDEGRSIQKIIKVKTEIPISAVGDDDDDIATCEIATEQRRR